MVEVSLSDSTGALTDQLTPSGSSPVVWRFSFLFLDSLLVTVSVSFPWLSMPAIVWLEELRVWPVLTLTLGKRLLWNCS